MTPRTDSTHALTDFRRAFKLWTRANREGNKRAAEEHAETLKLLRWRYRDLLTA